MLLDPQALEIVALSAAGVAVLCLVLAVVALVRAGRLRRMLTVLQDEEGEHGTLVQTLGSHDERLRTIAGRVGALETAAAQLRADVSDAIRHVAVMRYDAFPDMGGRLSFSVALLDDAGDGVVVTSIYGRSESRSYAKGVKSGASDTDLSPEEAQAVAYALRGARADAAPAR